MNIETDLDMGLSTNDYKIYLDVCIPSYIRKFITMPFTGPLSQEEQSLESEISRVRSEYEKTYELMRDQEDFIHSWTENSINLCGAMDELWNKPRGTRGLYDSWFKEHFPYFDPFTYRKDCNAMKLAWFTQNKKMIKNLNELKDKLIDYHYTFNRLIAERIDLLIKRGQIGCDISTDTSSVPISENSPELVHS